jgi:hypothetical protein
MTSQNIEVPKLIMTDVSIVILPVRRKATEYTDFRLVVPRENKPVNNIELHGLVR